MCSPEAMAPLIQNKKKIIYLSEHFKLFFILGAYSTPVTATQYSHGGITLPRLWLFWNKVIALLYLTYHYIGGLYTSFISHPGVIYCESLWLTQVTFDQHTEKQVFQPQNKNFVRREMIWNMFRIPLTFIYLTGLAARDMSLWIIW